MLASLFLFSDSGNGAFFTCAAFASIILWLSWRVNKILRGAAYADIKKHLAYASFTQYSCALKASVKLRSKFFRWLHGMRYLVSAPEILDKHYVSRTYERDLAYWLLIGNP